MVSRNTQPKSQSINSSASSLNGRKRRATDESSTDNSSNDRFKPSSTMTEEDWPSQSFRDHVIHRLEPELQRNRQNAPNLPVPGDARQVEEYVFNKCISKDEYMRTIAKVINAINCNSKSAAVPSVLHPSHFTNNAANKASPNNGQPPMGQMPLGGIKAQIPPDPHPHHRGPAAVVANSDLQTNSSRFQTPPLGQPPPMFSANQPSVMQNPSSIVSAGTAPISNVAPAISTQPMGVVQQPGMAINGQMPPTNYQQYPQAQPHMAQQVMPNSQYMQDGGMHQQPYGVQNKAYGMADTNINGGANHMPLGQQQSLPPQQMMGGDPQIQHQRMWTSNGPTDHGRTLYQGNAPNQLHASHGGYMNSHGNNSTPHSSSSSVLENLINAPPSSYGSSVTGMQANEQIPPHILAEIKAAGEDEKIYLEKVQNLRQFVEFLRSRLSVCTDQKTQGNLHFAIEAILFRRHASLEQIGGIEMFIQNLMKTSQYVQQQSQMQQQPIVDAVNASVLLSESQPINPHQPNIYHQPNMSSGPNSSWPNQNQWPPQQDVKSGMATANMHLGSPSSALSSHPHNTPHHSSYGPSPTNTFSSPASNYSGSTNSFNNRPSPYPLPPHHMKYTNAGAMQQHHQQQNMQQYQQNNYMNQQQMHPMQQQNQMYGSSNMMGGQPQMNGYGAEMPQPMDMSGGMMASNYSGMSQTSSMGGNEMMGASMIHTNLSRLSEQARNELIPFENRISFSNNLEISGDGLAYILVCSLQREQVPNLRLIIPRAYPQHSASIEKIAIDLDSFYFDDLQNAIHDQISKSSPHTITEILGSWENAVNQLYSGQGAGAFDDILIGANFGDI